MKKLILFISIIIGGWHAGYGQPCGAACSTLIDNFFFNSETDNSIQNGGDGNWNVSGQDPIYEICPGGSFTITITHLADACLSSGDLFWSSGILTASDAYSTMINAQNFIEDAFSFNTSGPNAGTTEITWTVPYDLETTPGGDLYLYVLLDDSDGNYNNCNGPGVPSNYSFASSVDSFKIKILGPDVRNFQLTGGTSTVCQGEDVDLTLTPDQGTTIPVSVSYRLYEYDVNNGTVIIGNPVGQSVSGNNGDSLTLTVPNIQNTTSYTVLAQGSSLCQWQINGLNNLNTFVTVNVFDEPDPNQSLSPQTNPLVIFCDPDSTDIVINSAEDGIAYQLRINNNPIGSKVTASSGSVTLLLTPSNIDNNLNSNGTFSVDILGFADENCTNSTVYQGVLNIERILPPDQSQVAIVQADPVCLGDPITIEVNNTEGPEVKYQISSNGSLFSNSVSGNGGQISIPLTSLPSTSGTFGFSLQAFKENGNDTCFAGSLQGAIQVNELPTVSISGGGASCFEEAGVPLNPIELNFGDGSNPYTVTYTFDGGNEIDTTVTDDPFSLQTQEGTYVFTNLEDDNGCVATTINNNNTSFTVGRRQDLRQAGLSIIGSNTICKGESVTLEVSLNAVTTEDVRFVVEDDDNGDFNAIIATNTSSNTIQIDNINENTTFELKELLFINGDPCTTDTFTGNTSISVNVRNTFDNPEVDLDSVILCSGSAVNLRVSVDDPASVDAIASFSGPDGGSFNITIPASSTEASQSVTPGSQGDRIYSLESISYSTGITCEVTPDIDETVYVLADLAEIQFIDDNIDLCPDEQVTLEIDLPEEQYQICLNFNDEEICVPDPNPIGTADASEQIGPLSSTQNFPITNAFYSDSNIPLCLVQNPAQATINIKPKPVASFSWQPDEPCQGQEITIVNGTDPDNQFNYNYTWTVESESFTDKDLNYTFDLGLDTYNISLIAGDGECQDVLDSTITINTDFAPVEIYQLSKDNVSGVLLIAFDTTGNNKNIVSYTWFDAGGTILSGPSNDPTFFLTGDDPSGIYVVTELDNAVVPNCQPRSAPVARLASIPSLANSLKLYPNPNQGSFQIDITGPFEGSAQLRVVDLMGRVLYRTDMEKTGSKISQSLDLNLSQGTYQIQYITSNGLILNDRLVIQ